MCQIYNFFSTFVPNNLNILKTMSKRLFLLLVILTVFFNNVKSKDAFYPEPVFFTQDDDFFLHTIERGQTVYSIAIMYNVTVEDIYRLNPGSRKVIRAGEVLKIPQESSSYLYHTIQPQETLYGLSQKYHMKGEDIIAANPGLSVKTFTIGKIIRIPTNLVTTPIQGGNEVVNSSKTNSLLTQTSPSIEINNIKVALFLPFGIKDTTVQKTVQNQVVEYYEGFLLALEDLKKERISVYMHPYDIGNGTKELQDSLKKKEMKDVDLLIGGLSDEQIKLLSRFAKENNIPYVIPFAPLTNEPVNNSNVYQINTPQSYMYSKASLAFINKYGNNNNIIIVSDSSASNKKEFTDLLKQDLQDRNIAYKTVSFGVNFYNDITASLNRSQTNVIVPSDDSAETLSKLIPPLEAIAESQPDLSLTLFGYSRWQSLSAKYSSDFFRLNTTFFTLFYADPTSPDVKAFYSTFYKWYTRVLDNSFFPKYGILGYDMGLYFIRLIHTYGSPFYSHINDLNYNGLQTDFYFERLSNWGGFINTNMYLISYNSDYSITKNIVK